MTTMRTVHGWLVPCESAHCIAIRFNEDDTVDIGHTDDDEYLKFTRAEWDAFAANIAGGHFKLAQ